MVVSGAMESPYRRFDVTGGTWGRLWSTGPKRVSCLLHWLRPPAQKWTTPNIARYVHVCSYLFVCGVIVTFAVRLCAQCPSLTLCLIPSPLPSLCLHLPFIIILRREGDHMPYWLAGSTIVLRQCVTCVSSPYMCVYIVPPLPPPPTCVCLSLLPTTGCLDTSLRDVTIHYLYSEQVHSGGMEAVLHGHCFKSLRWHSVSSSGDHDWECVAESGQGCRWRYQRYVVHYTNDR